MTPDAPERLFLLCQVAGCGNPASHRCDAGFRYCKAHKKPHGDPPHSYRVIPLRERRVPGAA